MSCSPEYNSNKNTCYSLEDLKDIAKNYNKNLEVGKKIKLNQNKVHRIEDSDKYLAQICLFFPN